jgi:hypothetical protein
MPSDTKADNTNLYLILCIVGAVIIAFPVIAVLSINPTSNVIGDAQVAVKATLRDPGSAQFLDLTSFGIASNRAVCGKVNAKNGFGGYSGFVPFVYYEQTKIVDIARSDFLATKTVEFCKEMTRLQGETDQLRKTIKWH